MCIAEHVPKSAVIYPGFFQCSLVCAESLLAISVYSHTGLMNTLCQDCNLYTATANSRAFWKLATHGRKEQESLCHRVLCIVCTHLCGCEHRHSMSIFLVVMPPLGRSSCDCVKRVQGLQMAAAALQGSKKGLSQPANALRQVRGNTTVTPVALQLARLYMTNLVKPQSGHPVLTEMRGRRPSPAQVCSILPATAGG